MKRRHLRDDAIAFCREARDLRPDIVFGADLIAGFPTETEEMFRNTLDLVDECGLTYLHVFPFSPRQGTPAARMPQLGRTVVKQRAARLRDKAAARLTAFLAAQQGRVHDVLLERDDTGRTPQFAEVAIAAAGQAKLQPGTIAPMKVTGHDGRRLIAECIE